eukprot:CAMPEP_0180170104 /NCGR_PEP_ID=MMETSP0986-20121125/33637_1 /TAXON_ID=697907 /ORGANISM="non described non described, Strain CCMP2293" /LENGTH=444 /DNA_ID=CAMNT_0022121749 /DNA_START=1 /DNA_END=1332 /DNA_ORIENTATION=-
MASPEQEFQRTEFRKLQEELESKHNKAEELYKDLLRTSPGDAGTLCNYGCFLEDIRRDFDGAESMFKQALESNPRHVGALCNYGTLLQEVRGEYNRAEELYKKALEIDPKHITTIYNYGGLLKNARHDWDGAEVMYKRALELDPKDVGTLCNYGTLLHDVRKRYDEAEAVYKQALEVDPKDSATLCNYGLLLKNVRKDHDGAVGVLYQTALEVEPLDATTLCNYGLFLQNVRHDFTRAEQLYKRALACDGGHVSTLCNYGTLLTTVRKDYDKAVSLLSQAPFHPTVLQCLDWVRQVHASDKVARTKERKKANRMEKRKDLSLRCEVCAKVYHDRPTKTRHLRRVHGVEPDGVHSLGREFQGTGMDEQWVGDDLRRFYQNLPTGSGAEDLWQLGGPDRGWNGSPTSPEAGRGGAISASIAGVVVPLPLSSGDRGAVAVGPTGQPR